ncbi:MAG: hypothetical protein A2660_01820 [Candidatus Doudnabacteria bacterium RIFCSPHIGHO2_01_FULL_45_18]|uniref:Uncharacterized protein n=1 Tax=Candidatus Doudnabacteria bacterium RIFCSPHIGHO2_01_FULL_45_18 TaxID=1817823 RepID=A0A1F5NRW6_9BACT|nr:MAG: hypothetical protein A2660_01820 [Candidatus Doudnabacteria bacterium RIFCSPHIGHO2_01_FULL_45_18]
MNYIFVFLVAFVAGFINNNTIKGLVYGKSTVPRGYYSYPTGNELLTGFRARLLGLGMLLITVFFSFVFLSGAFPFQPFPQVLKNTDFYINTVVAVLAIIISVKVREVSDKFFKVWKGL